MSLFKDKNKTKKNIEEFVEQSIAALNSRARKNAIAWRVLSITTALVNIIILSISTYLIYFLLETYFKQTTNVSLFKAIGPQLFIASTTILLFPLTFITIVYRSKMNAVKYKDAFQSIQFITMQYIEHDGIFEDKERDAIYKKQIRKILKSTLTMKHEKLSYKTTISKILLGDK